MFYQDPSISFRLTDVFYFERDRRDIFESGRTRTAISYRLEGDSIFYSGKKKLPAKSCSVTFIPPGCDYRHKTQNFEKVIILHLEGLGEMKNEIEVVDDAGETEPLFRKLLAVWEEGGDGAYNRCMSLLYRIFEGLQLVGEKKLPAIPSSIAAGVQLMRKSFRESTLTVAELAAVSFVSEVYFRRVYRSHFGESPLQTILNLRFQYACRLLRSGYYSQKQVAELSGFSDVKYFRTAFKKRYGITPMDYASL